jgi:hypothetical protein
MCRPLKAKDPDSSIQFRFPHPAERLRFHTQPGRHQPHGDSIHHGRVPFKGDAEAVSRPLLPDQTGMAMKSLKYFPLSPTTAISPPAKALQPTFAEACFPGNFRFIDTFRRQMLSDSYGSFLDYCLSERREIQD